MNAKGIMLIIGGAEYTGEENDKKPKARNPLLEPYAILKELLSFSKNKKIEIITSGSKLHEEVKKHYQRAFHKLGYPNPGFLPITDKMQAHDPKIIKRIDDAGAVFFTGGDQFRIATILGGTPITERIKYRYMHDEDFLIAGTSAGAMVMSSIMIASGGTEEALFSEDLKISSGLGLIKNCIIDTHFIKRGRFGRLAHAVLINPEQLGVGLGEDTALIIKNGHNAECRGSGMVVIVDGQDLMQTNVTSATDEEPVFAENFRVHLLVRGCRFSIKTRRLADPAIKGQHRTNREKL